MMKAVRPALHDGAGLLVLFIGLLLSLSARGAVTFTISPSSCSNTYAGLITMQITGLTNGETVQVRKYLDVNTNRLIDTTDELVQSLNLTDGQNFVIAGVTNFNVPGDSNSTTGAITATVSFPGGGFSQQLAGTYALKFASPSGRFTPITNYFTVTNPAYPQSFTGTVKSSGTNIPYAAVLLFSPPTPNGGMNPMGGTLANGVGGYTLKAPVGTYLVLALRSNYVTDLSSAPVLTLGTGATITTNLTIIPATRYISGRLVDAATNSIGLPGISLYFQSTNNLVANGFTDAAGNFSVATTSSLWKSGIDSGALDLHAYLHLENDLYFNTTTGTITAATIALPRATSLIYGTVKDDQNRPLATVSLNGNQNNGSGLYRGDALTDPNGNYVMGVVSGSNWSVSASSDSPSAANYVFSEPPSTNIVDGVAVQLNLTGILATNHISGYVRDNNNRAITNVGVFAQATLAGLSFNQYARTDTNGNYSFNVPNGAWNVGVNCGGGSDSLATLGYLCVTNQPVTISNNNATANFIAPIVSAHIAGYVRDTGSNAIVNVGVYAQDPTGTYSEANASTDGTGHYSLGVVNGTWNVGVSCYGGNGSLSQLGFLCVNEQSVTVSNNTGTANFTVLPAAYHISGYVHSNGGQPITNVNVNANATISGTAYDANSQTDSNGFYSLNVASGTWNVNVNCNGGPGDSLSSEGYLCVNSQSVTISNTSGVANFSALAAPYQIAGYLLDTGGHPITNININADADIDGPIYYVNGLTDSNGFYSLNVANGTWNVWVDCSGDPGSLTSRGYLCVNNQSVTISNANGTANFIAQSAPYQIMGFVQDAVGHPVTNVNLNATATISNAIYYIATFTDTNGFYTLHVPNGSWSVNVDCNALSQLGLLCPNFQTVNISNANAVVNFVAPVAPYQIAGYLTDTLAHPITNTSIYANANINGTNYNANGMTDTAGHYVVHVSNGSWNVGVGCNGFNGLNQAGYLCVNSQTVGITNNNGVANFTAPVAPYHITGSVRDTTNNPVANLSVFASSGPYNANAMTDSNGFYSLNVANGTWNVGLDCNGLFAHGYACPASQTTNIFNTNAVVNFTVPPGLYTFRPTITRLAWLGNGRFQFTFNTVTGISYTVQYSTNFSTWFSLLTLGGSGAPITVTDPSAAPPVRVYRIQLSQ